MSERLEYNRAKYPENFVELNCIEGLEAMYAINERGDIFSVRKMKLLKPSENNCGYLQVYLTFWTGGGCWYKVHRLVGMQFIPNPNDLTDINHINGNKKYNHVENLEWLSHSDNIKYSYRTLGRKHNATPTYKKVRCVTTGVEYESLKAASIGTGCKIPNISAVLNGKLKHTKRLVFEKI